MTGTSRPHVAIDLTPMLPGAENGGAKILTLELARRLAACAADWSFTLLTPEVCHDELAALERENMRRICVLPRPAAASSGLGVRLRGTARALASRLPPSTATRLIDLYWRLRHRPRGATIVDEIGADLLFNPFTAPLFQSHRVPSVSLVYDLQFAAYPQFFTADERYGREAHLRAAAAGATRLICISEYVRRILLTDWDVSAERVVTIPIRLARRLSAVAEGEAAAVLARNALKRERYLLYPANFWPHKNHRMMLLAFRQLIEKRPASDLALVCTGQPGAAMDGLIADAQRLGLGHHCRFPGFVSDGDLAALLGGCRAMVFPSLYEGFGMPLLEAMEFDSPILCSNRAALPEVAGDAAIYFDPRKPAEIVAAMERIDDDEALRAALVRHGRLRRLAYNDSAAMAATYLEIFADAMATTQPAAKVDESGAVSR